MIHLPFDTKELISQNLFGSDLANMARVDPEFRPIFYARVAPTFISEFLRVSKIYKYLQKIFHLNVSTDDIMEDGGDHKIMEYILDREVEEGEIFEDETDYAIWKTMNSTIDLGCSMPQIIDSYKYYEEPELGDYIDELFEEYGIF